jgi:hypothetical protein
MPSGYVSRSTETSPNTAEGARLERLRGSNRLDDLVASESIAGARFVRNGDRRVAEPYRLLAA